ncbi:hypothetical protein [Saccharothrix variisporea]|uniref:hypothetical protein n=1 Tax=Saccharothrix variisporea TaxID=543527 RepID=UPI0011C42C97|nr:hypothetical protein [Saccharothrix variisporea]
MAKITRRTDLKRRWHSWSGSGRDLKRLGRLVESLIADRRKAFASEFDELYDSTYGIRADSKASLDYKEERRRQYDSEFGVTIRIDHGGASISGPVDEVLEEMDRRRVTNIRLSGDFPSLSRGEALEIEFNWNWALDPVTLRVSSGDQGWANQAFARLSEEIDVGKPKTNFFLRPAGSVFLAVVSWLLLGASLFLIFENFSEKVRSAVAVMGGLGLGLLTALGLFSRKLLPPLEVVEEGGSGAAGRRLTIFLTSVLLAAIVGVVVNRIS